jgi:hypothetical protein
MQEYEVSAYGEPPLTVGEETQEAITSLVTDCITLYGGMEDFDVVEGVALLASWTSWFDYEYDSSRAPQDDGTEGDWIRPYKRGGVLGVITNLFGIFYIKPELINVLEEGCSLCYEKAIYTKLVIDVAIDHLDIEGVETHMVDVPEHASVSVIFNPNTVTADTVFVDGGRLYSPSEYSEVIGLMTEDEETGFVFTNLNLDRID